MEGGQHRKDHDDLNQGNQNDLRIKDQDKNLQLDRGSKDSRIDDQLTHGQSKIQQQNKQSIYANQYEDDEQDELEYQQDLPSMQIVITNTQEQQLNFDSIVNQNINTNSSTKQTFTKKDSVKINQNHQKNHISQRISQNNNSDKSNQSNDPFCSFGLKDTSTTAQNLKQIQVTKQQTVGINNQQKTQNTISKGKNQKQFSFAHVDSSEQKLYKEYQHDDNLSDSSDSESSLDSQASFAKMNARRTMLLSDDFYGNNHYSAIIDQLSQQQCKAVQQTSKKIAHLQSLIKRQSILLQFQQKTKNERVKQIQYSYVNAFNNFLFLRNIKHHSTESNPILLNSKDLYQIHEEFLDDLRRVKDAFGKVVFASSNKEQMNYQYKFLQSISSAKYIKLSGNDQNNNTAANNKIIQSQSIKSVFSNSIQPPESFLIDFHNFFPCWSRSIYEFMEMQFDEHQKIQATFQSQYTIPSKILSSIKYKDNVRRFCQIIFKKPIQELKKVKTQLIIDFSIIYQKWTTTLFNVPNSNPLKQFMEGKYVLEDGTVRGTIVQEIGKFFGQKMDPSEYEKLLIELNHFAKNRNAMNFLFNQIGQQQIQGEQINLRLALLVHKKMQINRRKLQQLSLSFINQIIDNYENIPVEIKYIVQVFKQLAKRKLQASGQQPNIKYEDLKSFFNKIIFSQLFFTIFMELLDDEQYDNKMSSQSLNNNRNQVKSFASGHQSHNIQMIALISQKIMFGQQFYQKFKYGYFNAVIKQYNPKIKKFIENFASSEIIKFQGRKQIQCMLVSLQTVKFLYEVLKKKNLVRQLVSFEKKLMSCKHNEPFALGSSRYTQQKMYIMIVYKPQFNYGSIFRPKQKFRRTLIQFLKMIESINDGVTFRQVLQQYKCMQEDNLQIAKPSIQIYSNYLSSFENNIENEDIVIEIEEDIAKTKSYIEKVKISLQREHNISMNMESLYRSLLLAKKKAISKENFQDYINLLFNLPLEFDYYVVDGKICENQNPTGKKKERVIKDCLNDVAAFFGKGLQGLDGLYALLLEKIVDEIEKQGVVDENMIESAQIIIGEKLYKMINLPSLQSQKDKKLYNSMKRHKFLNLKMLALPQYIDEEEIILEMSLQILQRLKHPMSPDKMIECFNQVTLVFQNVITCIGKASDITSDVQIPLMELILVKSMIPNLDTILLFIKTFSHNESGSNKYGMIIALVESICYLIQNMDAQHLGISQSQYVGYIENEYVIVDEKY